MRKPKYVLFILFALAISAAVTTGTFAGTQRASGEPPSETPTPPQYELPGIPPSETPTLPQDELPGIELPLGLYDEPQFPVPPGGGKSAPPSLISDTNAPAIIAGFDGIGQEGTGSPPDTHAAVGPSGIVEITNGHVAIYNKAGAIIAGGDSGGGAVTLNGFCVGEVNSCFDPKVIYDQDSGRFVAVVLELNLSTRLPNTSYLHIMVSTDSTPSNLTTDWDKFRQASSVTIDATDGWFDYPGLGVSPDAVVVSGNIFSQAGTFIGTKLRVFDKVELYDGDATATFVDIDRNFAAGGATLMPAHHLSSPPSGTFYMLQRWNSTFLRVTALTGVPGAPVANNVLISTANQGFCVSGAPQLGTTKLLSTVCPRMMNSVWRDGSIWGALTGSDTTDVRTVVQWFELETNGYPSSTPTVRQHGTIDEGTGEFTFMPSISVDFCGNAALTYTQSSSSRFPEMRYTGRLSGDTLNTLQAPAVAKASAFFFDDFTGLPDNPTERWGDYSATVIDPVDQSFWIAHEYAKVAASGGGNNGGWGTWITNFTFGCTPPPLVCNQGNNNGFELGAVDSNQIPCWTVVDQLNGSWCTQAGIAPPQGNCAGNFTTVPAPPQGAQAAMTNTGGFGSHVLYRCNVLGAVSISFQLYINNVAGAFSNPPTLDPNVMPNQQFRADLVTKAGIEADPFTVAPIDILLNIYQTLPGDPAVSGYTPIVADISAFIGQNVCLRFAEVDNQFFFHVGIDDVQVELKKKKPVDTDGDGCPDAHESGPDETQGGRRNYKNPYDYYDVYGPGNSLTLDGVIDLPNDILGVIQHFSPQGQPPYEARFDRGVTIGANHWERAGPDGVIDLPNDILGVITQFGHNCV